MAQRQREIIGIQYLRGIAAFAVAIDHAAGMTALPKYYGKQVLGGALTYGAFGVDVFFIISGFIIAAVSLDRNMMPAVSRRDFAWKRFNRIVPLMWIAILLYASTRVLGKHVFQFGPYVRALALVPFGTVNPDNIWTLRHEVIFYALFSFCFLGSRRRRLLITIWIVSPFLYTWSGSPVFTSTALGQFIRLLTYPINLEFGAGLLLGIYLHSRELPVFRSPGTSALYLLCMFCASWFISFLLKLDHNHLGKALILVFLALIVFIFGLLCSAASNQMTSIGRLIGDASYSIYLFHLQIESTMLTIGSKAFPGASAELVVIVVSIAAVGGGLLIHMTFERKFIKYLGYWFGPRPTHPLGKVSGRDE